jgi:tetratricopeptide (TPR) repeat protein
MRKVPLLSALLAALLFSASASLLATCGGGGGGGMGGTMNGPAGGDPSGRPQPAQVYVAPWKLFPPGQQPETTGGLILHWIPASAAEARASSLQVSRELSLAAAKCVTLALITPDNKPLVDRLAPDGKLPVVVLTDAAGAELARVAPGAKGLEVGEVEKMLDNQLDRLDDALKAKNKAAKAKAEAKDQAGAVALYQEVLARKCLFPSRAKDAAKALAKLGVPVAAFFESPEPIRTGAVPAQIEQTMTEGLRAEERGDYLVARERYLAASRLDPADPAPLRFLGELERHDTGEWAAAERVFRRILAMPADPLSRAVALHGLGKMTIHANRYDEGLALMQQSLDAYPLALTYRNLAVYWNEWDPAKAEGYMRRALALAPDDPYNLIFSATYLAGAGKREEALKIAREHEALLSASYNLAAVYALLGEKEKALAMLSRHFYDYEKFDAVRRKEMDEARVDVVFASLKKDPRFIALIRGPRRTL